MKHLFVINPCAGGENHTNAIVDSVKTLDIEAEVYVTQGEKDATRYVRDFCQRYSGEALRIYACGGDGTLNEVVSGVMACDCASRGMRVEVACYPCGSGNDYVKYWPKADFRNLKALTEAPSVEVDVMRICYRSSAGEEIRYALNTLNYGFEAEVCRFMDEVRHIPLLGGRMAYTTGIVKSLFGGRHNPCRITVDGESWMEGDLLLASMANGRYEGGGFLSAPRSQNDDGLLEITAVRPLSILRFASMIGYYKSGEYLGRPELQDAVCYRRGRSVVIEHDKPFYLGIDGELLHGSRFKVENLHRALRFVVAG